MRLGAKILILAFVAVSISVAVEKSQADPRVSNRCENLFAATIAPVETNPEFLKNLQDGITSSGLSRDVIDILKQHSAGVISYRKILSQQPSEVFTLLGVTKYQALNINLYFSLLLIKSAEEWGDAYGRLKVDPTMKNHTAIFLEKLTEKEDPIVFLIPSDFATASGETKDEFEWFLAHQKAMKNVLFVFGGADLFPSGEWHQWMIQHRLNPDIKGSHAYPPRLLIREFINQGWIDTAQLPPFVPIADFWNEDRMRMSNRMAPTPDFAFFQKYRNW